MSGSGASELCMPKGGEEVESTRVNSNSRANESEVAAAKSYVPAHALPAGATYNVLLMAAMPKNEKKIDVHKELCKIMELWQKKKGVFDVGLVSEVTSENIQDHLLKAFDGKLHLLHIACHGESGDDGKGVLILEDGVQVKVAEAIGPHNCKMLHGVFLNACHSGLMKDALLANGAAFVITCNQEVVDKAGLDFAKMFYSRLFEEQSLYEAFEAAEKQLKLTQTRQGRKEVVIELHCKATLLQQKMEMSRKTELQLGTLIAPPPSFCGRDQEQAAVLDCLQQHKHVTICGPAGIGKTTLATAVAKSAVEEQLFPGGVFFCSLQHMSRADVQQGKLLSSIARALRPRSPPTSWSELWQLLSGKNCLLILDDCDSIVFHTKAVDTACKC
eukprot:g1106.t1